MNHPNSALSEGSSTPEGVLSSSAALRYLSEDQLRWKVASGRWQKPARESSSPRRARSPNGNRSGSRCSRPGRGPPWPASPLPGGRLPGSDDKAPVPIVPSTCLSPTGTGEVTPPLGLNVVTHYSRCSVTQTSIRQGSHGEHGLRGRSLTLLPGCRPTAPPRRSSPPECNKDGTRRRSARGRRQVVRAAAAS